MVIRKRQFGLRCFSDEFDESLVFVAIELVQGGFPEEVVEVKELLALRVPDSLISRSDSLMRKT